MRSPGHPLELSELVDLELRFGADRELDPKRLRDRDEQIGRRIDAGHSGTLPRHEVFRRWLASLRNDEGPTVGEQVQAGYRLFGLAMAAVGFALGAGSACAVLAYDGRQPVNVIHFLAVFVVAQLVLIAVAVVAMIPRGVGRLNALGPLPEMIRVLTYRRSRLQGGRPWLSAVPVGLARVGALGSVYGRVERWLLLSLTQRTAFFFNLGALGTCLYLITFTDLAFAWSTTLNVEDGTMTRLLRAIAFPWRWLDAAVPTPDLVAASRYFRSSAAHDPSMLKDWWAFLTAALVTYGLFPRLLLWSLASWQSRRSRSRLALDHGDAQVAYARITRSTHGWTGHERSVERDAGRRSVRAVVPAAVPGGGPETSCTIIRWADVPVGPQEAAHLAERRFGWRMEALHECGGRDGAGERDQLVRELAREPAERPLLVLAESWEAPSRALTGFLETLRAGVASRRPLIVGLLDARGGRWSTPTADDREVWEQAVASLADPYARIESLVTE